MNVEEFNNNIVKAGKRMFGDQYSFSSSHIQSTMFGHVDKTETTYRATIFRKDNTTLSVESTNIDVMFDMLDMEEKKLNAIQSTIEL